LNGKVLLEIKAILNDSDRQGPSIIFKIKILVPT